MGKYKKAGLKVFNKKHNSMFLEQKHKYLQSLLLAGYMQALLHLSSGVSQKRICIQEIIRLKEGGIVCWYGNSFRESVRTVFSVKVFHVCLAKSYFFFPT